MSIRRNNRVERVKSKGTSTDYTDLANGFVVVGLPGDLYHPSIKDDDGKPMTYAEVGTIHEFGSSDGVIPERSFLRAFLRTEKSSINRMMRLLAEKFKLTGDALRQRQSLALWSQGQVQEFIADLDTPENAARTIRSKGFDNPLIETGAMRLAIIGLVMDNDED